MPIEYLEHFLLQTEDFEATVAWWRDIAGLVTGPTPNFGFPVQWMYAGDRDVLHITHGGRLATQNRKAYLGQESEATRGSGVVDHIAFRCTGLQATMQSLRARAVAFNERRVDDQGVYQLFLFDPNSVKVELNFPASEAGDLQAPVMASTFTFQHVAR